MSQQMKKYIINNGYRVWTTDSLREVACEVMGVDNRSVPSELHVQGLMRHIEERLLREHRYRHEMVPGKYIEVWQTTEEIQAPIRSHRLASLLRDLEDTSIIYVGFDHYGADDRDTVGYVVDAYVLEEEGDELHPVASIYLQIKKAHL